MAPFSSWIALLFLVSHAPTSTLHMVRTSYSYLVQFFSFVALNIQQQTWSSATYSLLSSTDVFNSSGLWQGLVAFDWCQVSIGQLALHLSVFVSHLWAYYLPIRDPHEMSWSPESTTGPLAGQGPATHGLAWKRPISLSVLSALLLSLPQKRPLRGLLVVYARKVEELHPKHRAIMTFGTDRHNVVAAARHQGGWACILGSAELQLCQTTARNYWSSVPSSWGELEQIPIETPPGFPLAMPWAWSSHKGNCRYSANQLAPKPWKTSGEKKQHSSS